MNNKVAIITLNWNGIDDTLVCVESLGKQTDMNFQLYLVDNGSSDDSVNILKDKYLKVNWIKLVLNEENLGFTKGNNVIMQQLINQGNHKYIILLNNDVEVDKNWFKNLVKSAKETKSDMIGSKMIDFTDREKMDNAGHIMLRSGEVLPLGVGENIDKFNDRFETFGACGGACLYSTKMLKDIGVFDEFFNTGYEDVELGVRAVLAGYNPIFEPSSIVYHKGSVSIDKIRDLKYAVKIQNSILYTVLKLQPLILLFPTLIFWIFRFLTLTLVGIIFWRPVLIKVHLISFKQTIGNLKLILNKRKKVKRRISVWEYFRKQTPFLKYYWKYFVKFIIKREKTVLERV